MIRVVWHASAERTLLRDGRGTLALYAHAHVVHFVLDDDATLRVLEVRRRGSR
jgi:hypothetical protein